MQVSHSGVTIDATKNPSGAFDLAINAALGCASKRNAWNWAYVAYDVLNLTDNKKAEAYKASLGNDNFPTFTETIESLSLPYKELLSDVYIDPIEKFETLLLKRELTKYSVLLLSNKDVVVNYSKGRFDESKKCHRLFDTLEEAKVFFESVAAYHKNYSDTNRGVCPWE